MMQELFIVGENQMVILNKPWISLIPAFRAILARDKGGPQDGSGKYKKKAIREFTFIYHMLDFRSPLESRDPDTRLQMSMEYAQLSEDKIEELMNKDEEYQLAWATYQDFIDNCSTSLQTLRDMKVAKHAMNKHLRTINFSAETNSGGLKYDIIKVQTAIKNMPGLEAAIDEMERQVRAQIDGTFEMRGGAEKGVEEDPEEEEYE